MLLENQPILLYDWVSLNMEHGDGQWILTTGLDLLDIESAMIIIADRDSLSFWESYRCQHLVDFSPKFSMEPKSWNMNETYHHMRLRKAPYTEFRRISTSLDDFSSLGTSPVFMINNIPMMDLELKDHDLISYLNPMCPQCLSRNVVKNGTCIRKLENGTV